MAKRLFDIVFASLLLLISWPILAVAAIGIRLSSPGPTLHLPQRVGRNGKLFVLYKFRTMHISNSKPGSPITAVGDSRVFSFGKVLRKLKIDELPQLWNVLRGEMSVVGPRPEDPSIVQDHYTAEQLQTLSVRPGLASPGSIFNYTHGDDFLAGPSAQDAYTTNLLPLKLSLEQVYVRHRSIRYDLRIIFRTIATITWKGLGRDEFPDPPEMDEAQQIVVGETDRPEKSTSAA